MSGSIEHSLYTGLQFGLKTSVSITIKLLATIVIGCTKMISFNIIFQLLFTPASNYLNKLSPTLRISDIYKVHDVLESMTSIIQYQQRLNSSEIASSQEAEVTNMVLQEVVEDTCDWVRLINHQCMMEPLLHDLFTIDQLYSGN